MFLYSWGFERDSLSICYHCFNSYSKREYKLCKFVEKINQDKSACILCSFLPRFYIVLTHYHLIKFWTGPNCYFERVQIESVCRSDKIHVTEKLKFLLVRLENIVGKREDAGFQHFLFFPQCF